MGLDAAAWTLIVLALATANLPFLIERPLLAAPWWGTGLPGGAAWQRWLRSAIFFGLLLAWCWFTLRLVGGSFAGGGDTVLFFVGKIVLVCALAAGLMALAGWRAPAMALPKPFFQRLLEVLLGYVLVGTLGLALELNQGNAFARAWEFYAITGALFLVLGYPGFVFRYMLKRRKR